MSKDGLYSLAICSFTTSQGLQYVMFLNNASHLVLSFDYGLIVAGVQYCRSNYFGEVQDGCG